ncbi:hypothetical protein JK359_07650 [Streptomyces actinomycinicus]|uniref:Uncharacterized protein n=1 Tax=Streptomyces actinomycinicus TaxID=1695166 RepID=A0A937EGP3_9ACTN|nr:hypothetical protein [Streptomyces actinomycinicus]MBL1081856.1 hypothetical protein [Streptomyces actinomycinicus]
METKKTAGDERPARTADEAVERLRDALREVGIVLPSLRVDPLSTSDEDPYALVDLGRCNLGVASRLAAVLRARGVGASSPDEVLRERVRQLNRDSVSGVT